VRILWCGPHPDMPTGYATQTSLILPRLQALGHQVALSATAGQESRLSYWRDIPVFPKTPYADVGEDVVREHYAAFKADLAVTFCCTFILKYPQVWRDMRTIHLTPVDCDPMSYMDYEVLAGTGGTPAAISRFGERMMRQAGPGRQVLDPLFLPHGVDTSVFTPPDSRDALRESMRYDGKFIVGMNFMNNDRGRKNVDECFQAFAAFRKTHPGAVLAVHAIQQLPEGYNLPALAVHLGLAGAVAFSPQYELVTGMISPLMLADWYGALDVLLSPGNEGFGLCAVEAQACGTPVILGDWSTGPELVGDGWLAEGQRKWNNAHKAFWGAPRTTSIVECLEEAYEDARNRREAARDNALRHDIGKVMAAHWEPVLGELG
jgi:glycosyltransferase involved in cell wall biosynthesis